MAATRTAWAILRIPHGNSSTTADVLRTQTAVQQDENRARTQVEWDKVEGELIEYQRQVEEHQRQVEEHQRQVEEHQRQVEEHQRQVRELESKIAGSKARQT